ncbi:unnamed protein product [Effrenium voratum]|nr:unnamed protein product [Effrenium voratum]
MLRPWQPEATKEVKLRRARDPLASKLSLHPERETQEAVAVGLEHPSQEAVAALNAAFYEGEEAGPISLAGRRMLPAQRLEIGDFLVVRLAEGELGASSEAKSVLRGDDLSGLLRASCGHCPR